MAVRTESLQVSGVRCERCVLRLGGVLDPLEGIRSANANLMGQVWIEWDDERIRKDEILDVMANAGFRPVG